MTRPAGAHSGGAALDTTVLLGAFIGGLLGPVVVALLLTALAAAAKRLAGVRQRRVGTARGPGDAGARRGGSPSRRQESGVRAER